MNRTEIKGILFDAGETLFTVKGSVGQCYADVAGRFGLQVDPSDIQHRFVTIWKKRPPLAFPGVPIDQIPSCERRWWRELVLQVFDGMPLPDFDPFFNELYGIFEGEHGWVLYPETDQVLKDLKAFGFRLGVVSNFDSRLFTVCGRLGIDRYFDVIVISSQVGVAKPSPEIFHRALARLELNAREAAFVGDSPLHDLSGARTAGLLPILVDRKGRFRSEAETVIDDLRGLIGLFGAKKRRSARTA